MMKYKTEYQIVICHNDMLTKLHNIRLELWRKSPLIIYIALLHLT